MNELENEESIGDLMRSIPELESLLYDLDLMPEQVKKNSKEEREMYFIADCFQSLRDRFKK